MFVAKSLHNIPPVTKHEFGVGKILSELNEIKSSIKNLESDDAQKQESELGIASDETVIKSDQVQNIAISSDQADTATKSKDACTKQYGYSDFIKHVYRFQ